MMSVLVSKIPIFEEFVKFDEEMEIWSIEPRHLQDLKVMLHVRVPRIIPMPPLRAWSCMILVHVRFKALRSDTILTSQHCALQAVRKTARQCRVTLTVQRGFISVKDERLERMALTQKS